MENLDKKWNIHKVVQEAIRTSHLESAPETRERLAKLEANNQNFMDKLESSIQDNKEAHNSIILAMQGMEKKLDDALEKKADKSELQTLWKKYESINEWKWKAIGIGIVVSGLATFLAVELYRHLTK